MKPHIRNYTDNYAKRVYIPRLEDEETEMEKRAVVDPEITPDLKHECCHDKCIEKLDNDLTKEAADKVTERLIGKGTAYDNFLE